MKKIQIFLIAFIVLISLNGCMSKSQKEAIYNKAVPIATEYMNTHFDSSIVISNVFDINDPANSTIVLYGYLDNQPEATFSISISHKTYEVAQVAGSRELWNHQVKLDKETTQ